MEALSHFLLIYMEYVVRDYTEPRTMLVFNKRRFLNINFQQENWSSCLGFLVMEYFCYQNLRGINWRRGLMEREREKEDNENATKAFSLWRDKTWCDGLCWSYLVVYMTSVCMLKYCFIFSNFSKYTMSNMQLQNLISVTCSHSISVRF